MNASKPLVVQFLRWLLLSIPVAAIAGSLVAFFLWALDIVTKLRWEHAWLLYLLPLAGLLIYFLYKKIGKNAEKGNALIIDEIHEPGAGVPLRMTPLVLGTTLLTHLFGGSAGREGTAVQMGGSIAAGLSRFFKLQAVDTSMMLKLGVAAGFGAVFGTPFAGAAFALEVLIQRRIDFLAIIPCLAAAFLADIVCRLYGIQHTHYAISALDGDRVALHYFHFNLYILLIILGAGICFGLAARLFIVSAHGIRKYSNKMIPYGWLVPIIGGLLIILLVWLLGNRDYLGLGVINPDPAAVSIVHAFQPGGAEPLSWFWKMLFTVITIGMGFKGGEVTPLFFIGAALGNTIAVTTGAPVDLFAALGFIAIFAGATKTPIACTLMGVELFGGQHVLYYGVVCFIAYYSSGRNSIYRGDGHKRSWRSGKLDS